MGTKMKTGIATLSLLLSQAWPSAARASAVKAPIRISISMPARHWQKIPWGSRCAVQGLWRLSGLSSRKATCARASFYGSVDKELIDGAFESFSAFNHVNTKIEWRLDDDGEPYAAILRWFIDNPGPDGSSSKASRGEILVVSKVGNIR